MSILSNIYNAPRNLLNATRAAFGLQQTTADRNMSGYWSGANMQPFDGEKTPYELGQPKEFVLDYSTLRMRAWEAYIKSDIVQNAIKKYVLWVLGEGLKLHPVTILLSLAVWGLLWGPMGMLMAVPIMATLRIVLEQFVITHTASRVLAGKLPGFPSDRNVM